MFSDRANPAATRPERVITIGSLIGIVSATALVDLLILTFAFVALWAVGAYLRMSAVPFAVFSAVILIPTVWACYKVALLAFEAETDPANN
ncbi:MAG: hypothetical protein Tsb0019_22890 [Roseibium sp.]